MPIPLISVDLKAMTPEQQAWWDHHASRESAEMYKTKVFKLPGEAEFSHFEVKHNGAWLREISHRVDWTPDLKNMSMTADLQDVDGTTITVTSGLPLHHRLVATDGSIISEFGPTAELSGI